MLEKIRTHSKLFEIFFDEKTVRFEVLFLNGRKVREGESSCNFMSCVRFHINSVTLHLARGGTKAATAIACSGWFSVQFC